MKPDIPEALLKHHAEIPARTTPARVPNVAAHVFRVGPPIRYMVTNVVIKHTNSETLKAKYKQLLSAHYYFTAEYQKSLETSRELLNHLDIFEESFVLACIAINQFRLNQFEEAEKNIKKAKLLNSKNKEIHDIINTYYEAIMTDKNK